MHALGGHARIMDVTSTAAVLEPGYKVRAG